MVCVSISFVLFSYYIFHVLWSPLFFPPFWPSGRPLDGKTSNPFSVRAASPVPVIPVSSKTAAPRPSTPVDVKPSLTATRKESTPSESSAASASAKRVPTVVPKTVENSQHRTSNSVPAASVSVPTVKKSGVWMLFDHDLDTLHVCIALTF